MNKIFYSLIVVLTLTSCVESYSQHVWKNEWNVRSYQTPSTPPFISAWDNVPAEIRNSNPFRRLEWFYRPRQNELGIFPKEFIDAQKEIEISKMNVSNDNPLYQWANIGPVGINMSSDPTVAHWGVVSGRVKGLAVHPTNPDIVYAGAGGGGIWKTTNGGQSWTDKSGSFNLITCGAIAIDPVNPEIVYAGSGEFIWTFTERFYNGDGFYKSTNGGDNWVKLNTEFGVVTHFTDLVVSPYNPNILFAAIAKNIQNATPNHGIWRSTNAGLNWTRVLFAEGVFDLSFHPSSSNIVYASVGANQSSGGFLVSTDYGITFAQSNNGLPSPSQIGRLQFDISVSNPSFLYAAVYVPFPQSGNIRSSVYRSTNAGASWFQISQGVDLTEAGDQGFYDFCIAVSPVNTDRIFVGNVELVRSVNGSTFSYVRDSSAYGGGTLAFDSYTHLDHQIMKYAPSNPSVIYIGCDGGVFKSTNSGQSFFSVNTGINSVQLYRSASFPGNQNRIYAGAQDNGFISTNNKGTSPYTLEMIGDGTECFVDYSNSNNIFFGTICGNFGGSTNGGLTWDLMVDPVTFDSCAFLCPYWQNPVNPNIIYGCLKQKLIKSTDKGLTWAYTTPTAIINSPIYFAAQSKYISDNIMVASRQGSASLIRSSDGGYNWQDITGNLGTFAGGYYMRLIADPSYGNTFYLLKSSYTGSIVLKTTNFGTNWIDLSSDLPKVPASDLFVDTSNAGVMYLANDFGVYRTTNSGNNWARLNNGMPFVPVLDFSYYNYNGIRLLRAATFGRGIFELDITQPIAVNDPVGIVPSGYSLGQNYPNPFNPTTKIDFQLPVDSKVSLVIYDITGRKVNVLLNNEFKKADYYMIQFNSNNLSSGTYFYRIVADKFVMTKKMILLK